MMQKIKKVAVLFIVTLVILSALIFPTMAAIASNSVTWDSEYVWLTTCKVYGHVEITEYTGLVPTAYICAIANNGASFYEKVTGIGSRNSSIIEADLSIPFLTYTDTGIRYD